MSEERLARIEVNVDGIKTELDKVSEALVTMARLDERLVTLFKRMDTHMEDVKALAVRISALERNSSSQDVWGYIGDKFLWVAVGGFVAWLLKTQVV